MTRAAHFFLEKEDTKSKTKLVNNAMKWLSNGKAEPKIAGRENVKVFNVPSMENKVPTSKLAEGKIDVYCIGDTRDISDDEIGHLIAFVKKGGSLMYASTIWADSAEWGERSGDK